MDEKIFFDPKPITDLMFGYMTDYMNDIVGLRRTYRKLTTKTSWTRSELELFRLSIQDSLAHIEKSLEELEAEAGVKIPR